MRTNTTRFSLEEEFKTSLRFESIKAKEFRILLPQHRKKGRYVGGDTLVISCVTSIFIYLL